MRVDLNRVRIRARAADWRPGTEAASGVRRTVCERIPAVGFSPRGSRPAETSSNGYLPGGAPFHSEVEIRGGCEFGEAMVRRCSRCRAVALRAGEKGRVSVKVYIGWRTAMQRISGCTEICANVPELPEFQRASYLGRASCMRAFVVHGRGCPPGIALAVLMAWGRTLPGRLCQRGDRRSPPAHAH